MDADPLTGGEQSMGRAAVCVAAVDARAAGADQAPMPNAQRAIGSDEGAISPLAVCAALMSVRVQ